MEQSRQAAFWVMVGLLITTGLMIGAVLAASMVPGLHSAGFYQGNNTSSDFFQSRDRLTAQRLQASGVDYVVRYNTAMWIK